VTYDAAFSVNILSSDMTGLFLILRLTPRCAVFVNKVIQLSHRCYCALLHTEEIFGWFSVLIHLAKEHRRRYLIQSVKCDCMLFGNFKDHLRPVNCFMRKVSRPECRIYHTSRTVQAARQTRSQI